MISFIEGALALYAAASAYLLWRAKVHPTASKSFILRALRGPVDAIREYRN